MPSCQRKLTPLSGQLSLSLGHGGGSALCLEEAQQDEDASCGCVSLFCACTMAVQHHRLVGNVVAEPLSWPARLMHRRQSVAPALSAKAEQGARQLRSSPWHPEELRPSPWRPEELWPEPLAPQELRALAWGQDHMRPTPKGKLLKPKNVSGNDMMVAVPWAPGLAAPPLSPAARPFVIVCPLTPEGTVAAICWSVPRP